MKITDSITSSLGAISTKSLFKAEPQYKAIWKCKLLQNTVAHLLSTSYQKFHWGTELYIGGFCFPLKINFRKQLKWVSPTSPKILETNVHIHFHTFCEPSGNFTFLSCMLFTLSTLKESPALCSLHFCFSVCLHSVNAQSPLQSLCPNPSWWPAGLHRWALSLNRWLAVGADKELCHHSQDIPGSLGFGKHNAVWEALQTLLTSICHHWFRLSASHSTSTFLPPHAAFGVRTPRKLNWDIQKYLRRWESLFLRLVFL